MGQSPTRSADLESRRCGTSLSSPHAASGHDSLSAIAADDEPAAVAGVLETLSSGLGDDSALVGVIIEQMEALTWRDVSAIELNEASAQQ
jgi:phenylpyruvate tautomerase PptA (4-oxalocrotonate tautomerase family)